MIVTPGEARTVIVYGRFPTGAVPSVEFTNSGGTVQNLSIGRVRGTFAEFVIPGSLLFSSNLPATAKFKVDGVVKQIVEFEQDPATTSGLEFKSYPTPLNWARYKGPVTTGSDVTTVGIDVAAAAPPGGRSWVTFSVNTILPGTNNTGINLTQAQLDKLPFRVTAGNYKNINNFIQKQTPFIGSMNVYRMLCDGDRLAALFFTGAGAGFGIRVFIDGKPTQVEPYAFSATTASTDGYVDLTFPDARTREIEVHTTGILGNVYTLNPYNIWQPPPASRPRVAIIGDSFVAPTVLDPTPGLVQDMRGIYQRQVHLLDIPNTNIDGVGGTGYGASNNVEGNRYLDRLTRNIALNPEVLIVHGGGANDLYRGRTVAQAIEDVVSLFTTARAALPNAKLVFVEGFVVPVTFSTYRQSYIDIRTAAQARLNSVGVYYIDTATSETWIKGTGYVGATNGSGNSDIYVGSDGIHLTAAGNRYVGERMAHKLARVLADDGTLVNTLI